MDFCPNRSLSKGLNLWSEINQAICACVHACVCAFACVSHRKITRFFKSFHLIWYRRDSSRNTLLYVFTKRDSFTAILFSAYKYITNRRIKNGKREDLMEETGRKYAELYISWSSKCINENPACVIWLNMDLCFPSTRDWVLAVWWKHIICTRQWGGREGGYSALNLWPSILPGKLYFTNNFFLKVQKESTCGSEHDCVRDCCHVSRTWERPSTIISARRDIQASVIKITSDSAVDPR